VPCLQTVPAHQRDERLWREPKVIHLHSKTLAVYRSPPESDRSRILPKQACTHTTLPFTK
jgi:hypothetical protein